MPTANHGTSIMRMGILAKGVVLTDAIRTYAQKRLRTALGRYPQAVDSAHVRLADINGPRGGIDKQCLVEVRGPAFAPILVSEDDADLYVAIDRAADRIDRAVARRLARSRDVDRGMRR
jgi:ribosomal subunit interface protein